MSQGISHRWKARYASSSPFTGWAMKSGMNKWDLDIDIICLHRFASMACAACYNNVRSQVDMQCSCLARKNDPASCHEKQDLPCTNLSNSLV